MIDFIEGILAVKSPSYAVIQAGGLGIRAHISLTTFEALPMVGEKVRLWSVLQLRDEELNLFAFSTQEERWIFQNLITVNGVGPKLAIVALSAARPDVIRQAVIAGDSARLRTIPRIGAKIAERIVLELKKKMGENAPDFVTQSSGSRGGDIQQAIDALCALGFSRMEAEKAVDGAVKRGATGIEELVKHSLRGS
jgi:Holliday junction DNA helicase RuvA